MNLTEQHIKVLTRLKVKGPVFETTIIGDDFNSTEHETNDQIAERLIKELMAAKYIFKNNILGVYDITELGLEKIKNIRIYRP